MTRKNCRIFPNGEFSVWEERKTIAVEGPPDQPDYLGLSLLSNSHRVALGMAVPPPERAKRGSKGITRHGARLVRNCAFLLQERYGRKHLGFYTFTLPPVDACAEYRLGMEWAEICRIFFQSVGRLLKAAGLPSSYVACSEIQSERYSERGGLPLHLHMVVVGRLPFKTWAIHSNQWRELWRRAVVARCPEYAGSSFAAAVDTVMVKKDAGSYLGKYMSKGTAYLGAVLADDPGLLEFLPSAWWNASLKLRRAVGARITGGIATAGKLLRDIRAGDSRVDFSRQIEIEVSPGNVVPVAVVGKLSAEGRRRYCAAIYVVQPSSTCPEAIAGA